MKIVATMEYNGAKSEIVLTEADIRKIAEERAAEQSYEKTGEYIYPHVVDMELKLTFDE